MIASNTPPREASRVLVFNQYDRCLLLSVDTGGATRWVLPGGGVRPGESPDQAARRELFEETGIQLRDLGPLLWTRTADFVLRGRRFRQHELAYLGHCTSDDALTIGSDSIAPILDHRWWSVAELIRANDRFIPHDLPRIVAAIVANGPPGEPLEL